MICYLKWDSEFFEKKIGKLENNILDSLDTLSQEEISYDLIYIFLSNRVTPTRNNTLFGKMNVRPNIQEAIYQAIIH